MTDELKKVYLDAQVDIILIDTIELYHPNFSKTWYLCKYHEEFEAELEDTTPVTFVPWGFDVVLPESSSTGQANTQFVIDVTDLEALEELRRYKDDPSTPIIMRWRQYFSTSVEPQVEAIEVKLMDIQFNYNKVSGAGSKPDIINRRFPYGRYDAQRLIGLRFI